MFKLRSFLLSNSIFIEEIWHCALFLLLLIRNIGHHLWFFPMTEWLLVFILDTSPSLGTWSSSLINIILIVVNLHLGVLTIKIIEFTGRVISPSTLGSVIILLSTHTDHFLLFLVFNFGIQFLVIIQKPVLMSLITLLIFPSVHSPLRITLLILSY